MGLAGLENDFTATAGLINRLALDSEINNLMQRSPFTTNQLLYCKNRTSSIYTDSSDDISSLAGSDSLLWDDGSFVLPTNTRSAQIAKIVEYFERKRQVPDHNTTPPPPPLPLTHSISSLRAGGSHQHNTPPPPPPIPNFHQEQQQQQHPFYRHRFQHHQGNNGSGSTSSSSSVAAAVAASYLSYDSKRYNDYRRHPSNAALSTDYESFCFELDKRPPSSQVRLMVCEGAVKSKLQIFDKTKQQKAEKLQQQQQKQQQQQQQQQATPQNGATTQGTNGHRFSSMADKGGGGSGGGGGEMIDGGHQLRIVEKELGTAEGGGNHNAPTVETISTR